MPENCRGAGAEGSRGGQRFFPVLRSELQTQARGMCSGLSLSLGALPWGVLLLALWKKNSGSQLRSGESDEGIWVLAEWSEDAVDPRLFLLGMNLEGSL